MNIQEQDDALFKFIQKASALKRNIPDSPVNDDNSINYNIIKSFDINSYFQVFDKIRLQQGKVLAYVYAYDRHGGMPFIYAKDIGEAEISDINQFWQRFPQTRVERLLGGDNSLNTISTYEKALSFEKSFLGYVQHSLFLWTSNKFFLFWHALYDKKTYLFSKQALNHQIERIVKNGDAFTPEEETILKLLDPYPKIIVFRNKVEVYLFSIDSATNGFYWNKTTYQDGTVISMKVINIVEDRTKVFY